MSSFKEVICVGHGIDVHAFTDLKQGVYLGGILVPYEKGLEGHSDADVVLHAIVDAVLGAVGQGDIGQHFPPSDPKWKGADSKQFLIYAIELMEREGGILHHIDVTLMGESPKVSPYRQAIAQSIASLVGLSVKRVNVKATTTEKLGFLGRKEGLACFATATVSIQEKVE
jgi:2-C-methyl-D-erythritol 4-phosphate cytidylyltransferase / 2-C-methyl-D-erythritol 2,4-cyclodiphosphate synthase